MGRQSRKVADADCQTTRRPGIDEPDDPDRRRPLAPAGRRCRDHSYTDSATNHLANGIETGKADTQFQAAARAGRVVFHLILECITGRKADMVISKSIAKSDLPPMADHMIARRDEHEPVFRKWKGLQFFGGIDLVPDDADLGQVSGDSSTMSRLERSSRSMSIKGCCVKNTAKVAGRNSAIAVVLASRRTRPLKPSAYSDNSPRIRSNC